MMCAVGSGFGEMPPANIAARPVTFSIIAAADEVGKLDGFCVFPVAIAIAIIGNAGARAARRGGAVER